MNDKKLRLALPTGSLNQKVTDGKFVRGDSQQLLLAATIIVNGYNPGDEETFPRLENLSGWDAVALRPQNIPKIILGKGADIGITGKDWASENGGGLYQISDLNYGFVRIVAAVRNGTESNIDELIEQYARSGTKLVCATEYVGVARRWIMGFEAYKELYSGQKPSIVLPFDTYTENPNVEIFWSAGKTENLVASGNATVCVEVTQTGSGLKKAGLVEIGEIMKSTARLYTREELMNPDPKDEQAMMKAEKIGQLAILLEGAVTGRDNKYFPLAFNCSPDRLEVMTDYLSEKRLCAKAPTVSREYKDNVVLEVLVPKEKCPDTIADLLRLGATDIISRNTEAVFNAVNLYR